MRAGEGAVYRVEAAETGDLPAVKALALSGEGVPRWPPEAWGTFVGPMTGGGRAAVLLLGKSAAEEVCGWLAGSVIGDCAELEFVWVRPAQRGHGLGRLLLQRWSAWAAEQGAAEMFLEVRVSNEAALALYRSFGFAEQGRRRGYYRDPVEDAVVMRASLPRSG